MINSIYHFVTEFFVKHKEFKNILENELYRWGRKI